MKDIEPVIAKAKAERRRFRRVRVDLTGRLFVPADSRECHCMIVDLSPGGASLECDLVLDGGTQIVLYIDGFGRLEGTVMRTEGADFGVRFNCTAAKRERIAEQLILFMNRSLIDENEMRRHDRTPQKGIARFTRADGQFVRLRGDGSFGERRLAQDRRASADRRVRADRPDGRPRRAPSRDGHRHRIRRRYPGKRRPPAAESGDESMTRRPIRHGTFAAFRRFNLERSVE